MSGPSATIADFTSADHRQALRIAEALIFASPKPLPVAELSARIPGSVDIAHVLRDLQSAYAGRGVHLVEVAGGYAFRTAEDLAHLLRDDAVQSKKLSRAALETLAIIAYHQPVTRAEIEEIRGVSTSKGTLDVLLETGWIRMRGRRRTPGRPVTYGTTQDFLSHFGLPGITDLPGLEELRGAGLLEGHIPAGFSIPVPKDDDELGPDEDALDEADLLGYAGDLPVDEDRSGSDGD
ncbi:Segregation and condensation protein B [Hartmannibacter diazotrophicus]|uniref:Segregation and condensation protein B n=1 Tax=Hartmannibacter diazotrophicus TaxID=1482074 RepID=A0A2C9D878_9HYPH|nr:SMC-Scp complex subunit ScpB [Hartmannibacter diazotrophicus]SON55951.1 Segregation and condensation protein B [Hartmannibacter diazotrophicus]